MKCLKCGKTPTYRRPDNLCDDCNAERHIYSRNTLFDSKEFILGVKQCFSKREEIAGANITEIIKAIDEKLSRAIVEKIDSLLRDRFEEMGANPDVMMQFLKNGMVTRYEISDDPSMQPLNAVMGAMGEHIVGQTRIIKIDGLIIDRDGVMGFNPRVSTIETPEEPKGLADMLRDL